MAIDSMTDRLSTAVVGASGYTGGELLRLLLGHPHVDVAQVTSERLDGQFVHFTHPNLRRADAAEVRARRRRSSACDLLFLCLPHGSAMARDRAVRGAGAIASSISAPTSGCADADDYDRWYGEPHANPAWLERFVYGLPELHRARDCAARRYVSGVGCNATATTLAVWPLAAAGLDRRRRAASSARSRSGAAKAAPRRATRRTTPSAPA